MSVSLTDSMLKIPDPFKVQAGADMQRRTEPGTDFTPVRGWAGVSAGRPLQDSVWNVMDKPRNCLQSTPPRGYLSIYEWCHTKQSSPP